MVVHATSTLSSINSLGRLRPAQPRCGGERVRGGLSDLVTELAGTRTCPLGHGEAVCIKGDRLPVLIAGRSGRPVPLSNVRPSGSAAAVQSPVEGDGVRRPSPASWSPRSAAYCCCRPTVGWGSSGRQDLAHLF